MKKNKTKNYLIMGLLLFGITLFFTNCEPEDYQKQEPVLSDLPQFKYKEVSKNDFRNNKNLNKKLSTIKEELNALKI